ncbi:unnamed protein product [Rotaria socialis]|uniref:C3H1-type domain-containing protein n=1 Tax=Rotaria socialis TaxID=392032 RepID=A0A818GHJ3_9BILA|nr:unnamed protein product [Rotaria socialis]
MMLTLRIPWTSQTLDKHVGDSTDSDNEEKEDGELEEGEVEEEFDETPQQKDDAKENNRENNSANDSTTEQDSSIDMNNHSNMGSQKFRRREYHHHHLGQQRLNNTGGQQDKRNKHEQRRKRRHSGEERDDRNRRPFKRGRFRGGPLPDLNEDGDEDDMMGPTWPPRGPNRGQRKQQSDIMSNENSENTETTDQLSSINPLMESKSEQSIPSDETTSPVNDTNDDENINTDEKQDRSNRSRLSRTNQQQNPMNIENRGRRYYDGNTNSNNNNPNNRRSNDRSSWQDRSGNNNSGNNSNSNNNQRFRSDTGSSTNHNPPLCKFFVENRCMKGNECLFSHDFKPQKKMEVCKYYVQNKGYCQKNDLCPYLHGEFPCKFFHTGTKDCMQGDRCKFSHDSIANDDIRFAFERFLNDSDEMNRQNRANTNANMHHNTNPPTVNFDVMNAPPLPPPPPVPGSLTDPSNFPMIPNLMDLLLRNAPLAAVPTSMDTTHTSNTETTATTINATQSSPPAQRPNLFSDTLSTEKTDNEESLTNKMTSSTTNSTSPSSSSSTQNATSSVDNTPSTTVTTVAASTSSVTTTTTNATCPLPLPPATMNNPNMNLPSPFGRLPPPNLTRPPSSLLPPPPPHNLFHMNNLGAGRVPIMFPTNNGLPLPPPPPNTLYPMKLLAQAAALAAVNAAVATNFTNAPHHHPQSPSPHLGRDIDERDRQSSTTMRGDIDERPSDVYNRPTTNLGHLQAPTNLSSPNPSSPTLTLTDEHLKTKSIQDIFRPPKSTPIDALSNPTPPNPTVGPSFDFISMLEQLKQPRQMQSVDASHDSLEIRSSSNQSSVYILRPVLVSFKPYQLPDKLTDPRIGKYQEKMFQWSEQARLERFKVPTLPSNNYSVPLRMQQQQQQQQQLQPQTLINDTNSSRDPRLLRNSVTSSKIGVSILPTLSTFVRPHDNIL